MLVRSDRKKQTLTSRCIFASERSHGKRLDMLWSVSLFETGANKKHDSRYWPPDTLPRPRVDGLPCHVLGMCTVRARHCTESPLLLQAHFGQPFFSLVQHQPFLSSLHPASQLE